MDVKPGFSEASLFMLKQKANEFQEKNKHLLVSLSVDDVTLRQHIQVVGSNVHGFIDLGDGPGDKPATDAMVVMCTTQNAEFKLPIGYFLIEKKFSGHQRAELMRKAIELVNNTGSVITNIACDNPKVNLSMLKHLGAVLDPDNLNPKLNIKNVLGLYILAMPDSPHLIKLTRNTLGDLEVLIDGDGNEIKWEFIVHLYSLQCETGVYLANKIRKAHVSYKKNKQKVKLATQTLSRSTSHAILFCCNDINLAQFNGAVPTADFILCFDQLFDILNSRNILQLNAKAPVSEKNIQFWQPALFLSAQYIRGLKHQDGTSILKGRRSAAFIGWLLNIESLKLLYHDYIIESNDITPSNFYPEVGI